MDMVAGICLASGEAFLLHQNMVEGITEQNRANYVYLKHLESTDCSAFLFAFPCSFHST
jgi:hypothetical protein